MIRHLRHKQLILYLLLKSKKEQGFTLIELIVILLVIGVMSAVAVPSLWGSWEQSQVSQGLSKLKSALQEAQANANRISGDCQITINGLADSTSTVTLDGKAYYEVVGTPTACLSEKQYIRADFLTISSSAATANKGKMTFNFRGEPDGSTPQTLLIYRNSNTNTGKCLVISTGIGMIRVGEYFGNASGTFNINNCKNVENIRYDNS